MRVENNLARGLLIFFSLGLAVMALVAFAAANNGHISSPEAGVYVYGPASGQAPRSMVILLQGANMATKPFLTTMAPPLSAALPDTVFVALAAPLDSPGSSGQREWFPLIDRNYYVRRTAMVEQAGFLPALIARQTKRYNIPVDRVAVVGYSQGAIVALYVAPRLTQPIAGIVAIAGFPMGHENIATEARQRPPVCLLHGALDTSVTPNFYYATQDYLQKSGFETTCGIIEGIGHVLDKNIFVTTAFFLRRVLKEGESGEEAGHDG